jgi:UDP-3-O-[3-hydroxymyristoyl] glucosamine N-acyltransferase
MGPDPRFYETLAPATLEELARLTNASMEVGAEPTLVIQGVGSLTGADASSVTYLSDRRHAQALSSTSAGACFLMEAEVGKPPRSCAILRVASPQAAYVLAAERLHRPIRHESGAPAVHPSAELEEGVVLGPGVTVGQGAKIGAGAYLAPGAVVGPGVAIGRDSYVGANAIIGFALVGDRVRIHAGVVIGEAGFGATAGPRGVIDVPQLGRVIIQDGVTIGSNSCIDRGAHGDTIIGENTKIDNLVQIGHSVVLGRNCLLASFTGISGSVVVGDGCQFGGRAGIADHLTIGAGARIAASGGLMRDVPPGETWGGTPARPIRQWMRETAWLSKMAAARKETGA